MPPWSLPDRHAAGKGRLVWGMPTTPASGPSGAPAPSACAVPTVNGAKVPFHAQIERRPTRMITQMDSPLRGKRAPEPAAAGARTPLSFDRRSTVWQWDSHAVAAGSSHSFVSARIDAAGSWQLAAAVEGDVGGAVAPWFSSTILSARSFSNLARIAAVVSLTGISALRPRRSPSKRHREVVIRGR